MTEIGQLDKPLFIRTIDQINQDIDDQLDHEEIKKTLSAEESPPYVDRMSGCGRCYRERWATYRGLPLDNGKGFSAPILRVFRLGHTIEDEVVSLLNSTPDYEVTDQQLEVGAGSFLGHIDGILHWSRGSRIAKKQSLLEIKSAKNKRWEVLTGIGYEAWNPGYADQLQAYMHFLPVEDAIIGVYNKDTSQIHWEQIRQDADRGTHLVNESALVTEGGNTPPPRPSQATSHACKYCKWCDRSEWCWNAATDAKFAP